MAAFRQCNYVCRKRLSSTSAYSRTLSQLWTFWGELETKYSTKRQRLQQQAASQAQTSPEDVVFQTSNIQTNGSNSARSLKYTQFSGWDLKHPNSSQLVTLCDVVPKLFRVTRATRIRWQEKYLWKASYLQDVSEKVMVEHRPVLSANIHNDFAEFVPDEVRQSFVLS